MKVISWVLKAARAHSSARWRFPRKKIVKFPSKISRKCWGLKNHNYGYDGKSELLYLTPLWTFSDEVFAVMVVVFVRSGNVNLPGVSGATFRNAGINGYDWSSRASSTRNDGAAIPSAYNLEFNASTVNPSNGPNERWHGSPPSAVILSTAAGCRSSNNLYKYQWYAR